jgi:hypothetical protein
MNEAAISLSTEEAVEAALRDELARGDIVLGTIAPILGHLLANQDHSLFSDEIVSRTRGMVGDIARQMLVAQAEAAGAGDPRALSEEGGAALTAALLADDRLVQHCHALAIEWQLTTSLETRNAIDPVLSPLLQALIASDDPSTASTAMAALAAQARFVQLQRRMEMPLAELPADHFHQALTIWLERADAGDAQAVLSAASRLRQGYDESAARLALLSRLVHAMGAGALAALSVGHAGAAMFLSALAAATGQDRDLTVLGTNDQQLARLALSLVAAGLKPKAVEEQFQYIHPDVALPDGFASLDVDRASALLASSAWAAPR